MEHNHLIVFSYSAAFIVGLLGTGHCLGMCGGLVSAFFMKIGGGRAASPASYLAYHTARVGIYGLIGLMAAALGTVLVASGRIGLAQGVLQIIAGLLVIVLGFDLLGLSPIRNRWGFAPLAWLHQQFATATQKGPITGALIGGAINGLMPCSMTMAMAVQASTAPTTQAGILLMLAFGIGTLPSMLFASILFGKLGARLRGGLLKTAGLFVIALGLSTLWQGLNYFLVMRKLIV